MAGRSAKKKNSTAPLKKAVTLIAVFVVLLFTVLDLTGLVSFDSLLIKAGVDVNAESELGSTVLMKAADVEIFRLEKMKVLIKNGANVNAKTQKGRTPLMVAVQGKSRGHNDPATIRLLIKAGADVNAQNMDGETALMFAVSSFSAAEFGFSKEKSLERRLELVNELISAGADINAKNKNGTTVLMFAIKANLPNVSEIIRSLIAAGADIRAQDNNRKTALDYAMQKGASGEMLELLLNTKAN